MTREEAIQYIDGLHYEEDFPYTDTIADFVKERNEAIDMAIEALKADRPRGKWTLKMNERFYWKECSVCGHKPPRSDEYGTYIESNYCPNCGAKMYGEYHETV